MFPAGILCFLGHKRNFIWFCTTSCQTIIGTIDSLRIGLATTICVYVLQCPFTDVLILLVTMIFCHDHIFNLYWNAIITI